MGEGGEGQKEKLRRRDVRKGDKLRATWTHTRSLKPQRGCGGREKGSLVSEKRGGCLEDTEIESQKDRDGERPQRHCKERNTASERKTEGKKRRKEM